MVAQNATQNLLLGILALQNEFIDRHALVAAFGRWVKDKSKPLAEVLVQSGALTPENRTLLEALVAHYCALHQDDLDESLLKFDSLGAVRKDLEEVAGEQLQATLSLAPQTCSHYDKYATQASANTGQATAEPTRFEVLRPHAKGGLGEVFVARDSELDREVALKQIQPRFADDEGSRARFRIEAEVTGGLEHPGIVPVYSLGAYHDGRPYYAMRFIRGESLKSAIEQFHSSPVAVRAGSERSLAFRQLLGHLVDVCNAVEYAHSRAVLHRDLKPDNIMLGKFGETLVVDWGLAKAQGKSEPIQGSKEPVLQPASGSGSAPTEIGTVLGTPQFMSPEQASGRWDMLSPASDVYSIGATLYVLLTGRSPIAGNDVGRILQQVQRGEFAPPRQVRPHVNQALEAICLKAMARLPEDRYASPRELADDLEHWLADEPVSAYRESWYEQLSRMLGGSHDDVKFHNWGNALLIVAAIVGVMEFSVFAITFEGPPNPHGLVIGLRAVCLGLIALTFWRAQGGNVLPTNTAERLMWSTWSGFLLGSILIGTTHWALHGVANVDQRRMYPYLAVLSGLAFLVMGAGYWGRCYLMAAMFLALSLLMPWTLRWVVLEYGIVWTFSLAWIGLHLRRVNR